MNPEIALKAVKLVKDLYAIEGHEAKFLSKFEGRHLYGNPTAGIKVTDHALLMAVGSAIAFECMNKVLKNKKFKKADQDRLKEIIEDAMADSVAQVPIRIDSEKNIHETAIPLVAY